MCKKLNLPQLQEPDQNKAVDQYDQFHKGFGTSLNIKVFCTHEAGPL